MGSSERKHRESEELRRKVLDAAMHILITEGYRNLSIRKISTQIEYSPAAIYHYFKDKEEIVSTIIAEGYSDILKMFRTIEPDPEDPEAAILSLSRAYVDLALANRNLFRAFLFDDIGKASEQIWILEEGISGKRESIASLARLIRMYSEKGLFRPVDPEPAALALWCALHGLVARLLIEEPVSESFREKLLRQLIELLVRGLKQ